MLLVALPLFSFMKENMRNSRLLLKAGIQTEPLWENGFVKEIGGLAGAGSEPSAADSVAMASIKHAANILVRPLQAAARLRFWTVQLLSVHQSELQTSASALPPGGGGRHHSFVPHRRLRFHQLLMS